jgi:hypothetical protein
VNLPVAVTIGNGAFTFCTGLSSVNLPLATSIGPSAFISCSNLSSVSLPSATFIENQPFAYCTGLTTVSLPKATSIGNHTFIYTGTGSLTLTLGSAANLTPPVLGTNMFDFVTGKTVTVKVPSGATGYGASPTDTTTGNWGNAFRGKGWDGTNYLGGTVNGNINLTIEYTP